MFLNRRKLTIVFTLMLVLSLCSVAYAFFYITMYYSSSNNEWYGTGSDSWLYADLSQWPGCVEPYDLTYSNIEAYSKVSNIWNWITIYNPNKLSNYGFEQYYGPSASMTIQSLSDGNKKCIIHWSACPANTWLNAVVRWKNYIPDGSSYLWNHINGAWSEMGVGTDPNSPGYYWPVCDTDDILILSGTSTSALSQSLSNSTIPLGKQKDRKPSDEILKKPGKKNLINSNFPVTFLDKDGNILYKTTSLEISKSHEKIEKIVGFNF